MLAITLSYSYGPDIATLSSSTILAFTLVLLSGLIHSVWNLFTKQSGSKMAFLYHVQIVGLAMLIPLAVWQQLRTPMPASALIYFPLSMLAHAIYTFALARAHSLGDLSRVYPIMRGTSPLIVPIVGVLLLQESLPWLGWVAIATIVIGMSLLTDARFGLRALFREPGSLAAFGVGLSVAAYTSLDKLALMHHVPIMQLSAAAHVGNCAMMTIAVRDRSLRRREWSLNRWRILATGVLAPGGYLIFLYALSLVSLSQIAPMREISTVFATLFGLFYLNEPHGRRRITASVIITAGVVLLGMI